MEHLIFDYKEDGTQSVTGMKMHTHDGYWNDGNSSYWTRDVTIDFTTGKVNTHKETTTTFNYDHDETVTDEETDLRPMTEEQENTLWKIASPFIDLCEKYPHRTDFTIFSTKQGFLYEGRFDKLFSAHDETDLVNMCNGVVYAAFLRHGVVLQVYVDRRKNRLTAKLTTI